MTRSTTLAVLAVAAFALAGCTQHSTGTPTTTATSAGSLSGSAPGGKSTASIEPCMLLNSSDIAQLGLPDAGKKEDLGGQRGCVWNVSGFTGYSLSVGIRDTQGISEINSQGGQLSTTPIGKHDARTLQQPGGSAGGCMIIIGITSSARIDIVVNANTTAQACQVVAQVAAKVEPHL